jgi:sterol desaturase/sphingolipid hydroxylase (fatty acid hydroxylase superfamily)
VETIVAIKDVLSIALYTTAIVAIVFETLIMHTRGVPRDRKSRVLGLKCGVLSFGTGLLMSICVTVPLMQLAYEHRIFDFGFAWPVWIACFVINDLIFYASHRVEHRVRLLWAVHTVHHSSRHFDLTAGVRGSIFDSLSKLPFMVWIPLLGIHPLIVVLLETAFRFYGLAYHTEAVDKLGILDRILVTPSNHRVHHGSNARYLDCNFGGFFILWDRLLGTYRPETERVRYGLVKDWHSYDLADAQLHEVRDLMRDVARAPSLIEKVRVALRPPGAH